MEPLAFIPGLQLAATGHDAKAPPLPQLAERLGLHAVFQPIFGLAEGELLGFEGLIRGREGPMSTPMAMFEWADRNDCYVELERSAAVVVLAAFAQRDLPGQLFLNLSCDAVLALGRRRLGLLERASALGIERSRLCIELLEHRPMRDLGELADAVSTLRQQGVKLALDDFGTAHASLQLALALRPDRIKLDKYFIGGIETYAERREVVRMVQTLAASVGAEVVAEGIETEGALRQLRELGVRHGQGWLLGRPLTVPARRVPPAVATLMGQGDTPVPAAADPGRRETAGSLLVSVIPLTAQALVDDAWQRFIEQPALAGLPVVDDDGRPLALLARRPFMDRYGRPFQRELFGRKPVLEFSEGAPFVVERELSIDELVARHEVGSGSALATGFVITDAGRYAGVGSFDGLMRRMAERRITLARHANPLTGLPGNVPVDLQVERLLATGAPFVACWLDIDHFKPFNDTHGWRLGDDAILALAEALRDNAEPGLDFIGHLGGDDFVLLAQSADAPARVRAAIDAFARATRVLYPAHALAAEGYEAADRYGTRRFFPLMRVSAGLLDVRPGVLDDARQLALAATVAKKRAKDAADAMALVDCAEALRDAKN